MQDHVSSEIKTEVVRDWDWPEFMTFRTSCIENRMFDAPSVDEKLRSREIAYLEGYIYDPGRYPDVETVYEPDFFDDVSGHGHAAMQSIAEDPESVAKALELSVDDLTSYWTRFVYLNLGEVVEEFRGYGLMLRLMREARAIFCQPGTLALLTAHPLAEQVTPEDELRLATYYATDQRAGFKLVSAEKFGGLMVACWSEQFRSGGDSRRWQPTGSMKKAG